MPDPRKNRRIALTAAVVAAGMVGLAYASVPLYRLFCQVTGFGGTPQRADAAPETQGEGQPMTIRFDANTASTLGWKFRARQAVMQVRTGDQQMAYYEATNLSGRTETGSAVFNVTPPSAGAYFNKIQCFCFTEQTLKPGETAEFPVVFYVDPAISTDPETRSISTITLSYTFYPAEASAPVQANGAAEAAATN
jgi:cytochrome c oxidase assembly protein subunit 11